MRDYLDSREREMLARGAFFGGWEDADPTRTKLQPLARFDHPNLHRVRMGRPDCIPEQAIQMQMRKAMAGAPARERVDAHALRRALQRGRLGAKQRRCVDDLVASYRRWEMHLPFTAWGLSIYALARVVTDTYGGVHAWAPWLNLWADNPERKLPTPPQPRRRGNRPSGANQ